MENALLTQKKAEKEGRENENRLGKQKTNSKMIFSNLIVLITQ